MQIIIFIAITGQVYCSQPQIIGECFFTAGVKERKCKTCVVWLVCCSSCSDFCVRSIQNVLLPVGAEAMSKLERLPSPVLLSFLYLGCSGTAVLWHLLGAGITERD